MKNFSLYSITGIFLMLLTFSACKKENDLTTTHSSHAASYTDLTLDDPFDLPDPAASESWAVKLFDLKEDRNGLTREEVLSLADPATNEDFLYALLFVEKYDRDEILWSWDEPADAVADDLENRADYSKWKWTTEDPIASMYCTTHKKYPAYKVKNRFTDPCGEVIKAGPVYTCGHTLCDDVKPLELQTGCDQTIVIPAGSVDALAAAIDAVCSSGTIILAAGMHTENSMVNISRKVTIEGEDGAVLQIATAQDADYPLDPTVGLYATNFGVCIKNLTIEPLGDDGGTAILLHNSYRACVEDVTINDFQIGIMVERSDKVSLHGNTIVTSGTWLVGDVPEAHGIVMMNGEKADLRNNTVSNALFGVWACDSKGMYMDNYTYENYIGLILCNVPDGNFLLPDGTATSSDQPATSWEVMNNRSQDNFYSGYLVIDGANNNLLVNNEGGNNAEYDIELAGDSNRFPIFTPTSHNNTVSAGSYNVLIKNCGEDNMVSGGTLVDTSLDPCF